MCDYCGKRKHLKPQCPLLKNNIKNNNYNSKFSNNFNYKCSYLYENQISSHNYDSNKNETDNINIKNNSNKINFNLYGKSFDISTSNQRDNSYEIDNNF